MTKQFGGRLTKALLQQYAQSPNWQDGRFQNLETTTMNISLLTMPKLLYKQFCQVEGRSPKKKLPVLPFDADRFSKLKSGIHITWYGHSAMLLRINSTTVLIDPMLGPNASPSAPFSINRFSDYTLEIAKQLPVVDLVLISHDHYDHLDMDTILILKNKARHFFTALGVKRHLVAWGIEAGNITEFDWWHSEMYGDFKVSFTPTRHFSGRGLTDRAKSLWGGWAVHSPLGNIWFSGDSGYGTHFKEIGRKLGPFDFAMMESGQYNEHWQQIHMFPEESVQAAVDAGVKLAMPVHWAGFALAQHHWTDPVNRFEKHAAKLQLAVTFPKLGEQFITNEKMATKWWHDYE